MIALLYVASVVFSLFMSWVMYSFAKDKGCEPRTKDKIEHTVMPFVPFMNVAWVFFKLL